MRRPFSLVLACGVLLAAFASGAIAEPTQIEQTRQQTVAKGVAFLKASQNADGSWTDPAILGITALSTKALLDSGVKPDDPAVKNGLLFLKKHVQKDGGIYHPKSKHRNYESSISVLAFQAANKNGEHDKMIAGVVKFLKGLQWDESEGIDSSDPAYGGAGYGSHQRPDLSNTQYFLEALKAAGVDENDEAYKKALVFVSRCQNAESANNTTQFAGKVNDGGFYYTPAAGGTSQAGTTANGGLRSYASMTYAGLKSMIYAGLTPKDQRVTAAYEWIRKFYSLTENPGMGKQGLFYYYHTFAKALAVLDKDIIEAADGTKHNWREELVTKLANTQKTNGSWVNEADRWYEGDPNLVTAFSLMALNYCELKPVKK